MIKESVFKSFDDKASLENQLAERIAKQLQEAVDARGKASLIVSGGSTPLKLFQLLSQKNVEWSDVYITLADERWVDADSAKLLTSLARNVVLPVSGRAKRNPKSPFLRDPSVLLRDPRRHRSPLLPIVCSYSSSKLSVT